MTIACGDCFRYVGKKAVEALAGNYDPSARFVHGTVRNPETGRRMAHAWVERSDGTIDDWQSANGIWERFGLPPDIPIDLFYDTFKPEDVTVFDAKRLVQMTFRHSHYGPFTKRELRHPTASAAHESDAAPTILVKGGRVDLYLENESSPIVLPSEYGLVHDPSGQKLDGCSLFIGPIELTDEPVSGMSPEAVDYFGGDYEARKAFLDVPNEGWNLVGRVVEIVYFRPGKLEDDWKHKFDAPQDLYRSGDWHLLRFPEDCKLTHRGIEKP